MVDEKRLRAKLSQFPLDWNIRFRLLDKLQSKGAHREVVHILDGATRPPQDLPSLQKIIDLAVWALEPSVAWRHLDDYLRDHPDCARGHYLNAKLLVRLRNLALARRHYQRAIALAPELRDDVLEEKIGGRTPQETSQAYQAPATEASPAYEVAPNPRPITSAKPIQGPGKPLTPLIDPKTEPVKLPPPRYEAAPAPAPIIPPEPEPAPVQETTFPGQDFEPVPGSPKLQSPPPMFPAPPPVETLSSPEYVAPEAPEQAPVYYAEEPAYEEPYQEEVYAEEAAVEPPRDEEPPQFGSVAPLRPPVVETGWQFLNGAQQQAPKSPQSRGSQGDAPFGSKQRKKRRRKPAVAQMALILFLVALGHASVVLAPRFLVSDIPEQEGISVVFCFGELGVGSSSSIL